MLEIFKKLLGRTDLENHENNAVKSIRNWYEEKYDSTLVQRNILFVILSLSICMILVLTVVIYRVSTSKKIHPFIIALEEQTGATTIVTPATKELLSSQESLARYFIKKYVIARETYNPVNFEYNKGIIKLFSTTTVNRNYLSYIAQNDPSLFYDKDITSYLSVRSWSKLGEKTYMLRFYISDTGSNPQKKYKIAVIDIDYVVEKLQEAELDINPVGFQVTGYRVDDDNS